MDCIFIPMWLAGIISFIFCILSGIVMYRERPFHGSPEKFVLAFMIFMLALGGSIAWLTPYAPCIMLVK